MLTLTLDILQRTFKVGIVIFDREYNVICINKTVEELFGINIPKGNFILNLSEVHSQKTFTRIKKMTEEAVKNAKSGSYVIKLYHSKGKEEMIFIGKVFLLHGQCRELFIALLYNVTDLLTDEQDTIVKFPVYEGDNFLLLDVAKIEYFKAVGNYTEVFYNQKNYLSPLSLGEIEKKLNPNQFVRCHKSFIVNLEYIKKLKKSDNKYRILMKNDHDLPLSRNKVSMLLKLFGLR